MTYEGDDGGRSDLDGTADILMTLVQTGLRSLTSKDKDKDLFIGPQEFVVGYSKAPEQPQSSARPICHSHTMTRTGREPATIRTAA